jgi:hypothetical protein
MKWMRKVFYSSEAITSADVEFENCNLGQQKMRYFNLAEWLRIKAGGAGG